ncbi:MAG TPA: DUF4129 domain-containing protein [Dongiaceae bacterium]
MAQGSSIGGRMAEAAGRGLRLSLAVWCLAWGLSDCLTASIAQAQEAEKSADKAPDLEDLSRLPPDLREPLAKAYAPEDLQATLPEDRKIEPIDLPRGWNPPDWLARIVEFMFWLLIGVGALLAVFYLGREVPAWLGRRRQLKAGAAPMVQGSPAAADSQLLDALGRADRLAAEGQFADALHLLLLHSIDYLKRHLGGVYGPSSTAREILQRARLPDSGRNSLGAIVDAAEVSYFGGRPVDGGIYAACRRHYQSFAFGGSPS